MTAWKKKSKKSMETFKSGECSIDDIKALSKEKHFSVWAASTLKTIFGILKQISDYKVENLPKGGNLVILHTKLTFIGKNN